MNTIEQNSLTGILLRDFEGDPVKALEFAESMIRYSELMGIALDKNVGYAKAVQDLKLLLTCDTETC